LGNPEPHCVLKDFHFNSLHTPIQPLVLRGME
jgi:hypothetical protein